MSYRPFNNELRDSLYNNEPYIVAHLVKFERPTIQPGYSGISSREATGYTYLTDANYNIDFNDGSFSRKEQYVLDKEEILGTSPSVAISNGTQTYHANKLLSVGTINEGIEAKASSLSLELDAAALGTLSVGNFAFPDANSLANTVTMSSEDLSEVGFKEGDKILFSGSGANDGLTVLVNRFVTSGSNNQIKVTVVGGTYVQEASASLYTVSLLSEELATLLIGDGTVSYTNYINREVTIYRVHINPETNQIIGGTPGVYSGVYNKKGAMLLFKGIISGASLNERPNARSSMKWVLSSHWGDFVRVQNRLTDDESHRALDQDGYPDDNMLIRKEYANDLGFEHSELALNLTATYNRKETRIKKKTKKKWYGSKKTTDHEYEVDVPTDVDLEINLEAKALPVVYGVQKVDAIPFFFDNLKDRSEQVYIAYALAEGPIAGILDVVIDDKTTLCIDAIDATNRSVQDANESIDVVCKGRMDKGDVLTGASTDSGGIGTYVTHIFNYTAWQRSNLWSRRNRKRVSPNNEKFWTQETRMLSAGGVGGAGILHEQGFKFDTPIDCTLIFHRGEKSQRANRLLVEKANAGAFKVQNDFYSGAPHQYWTPNHRLLDTAYVVGEYVIGVGEEDLPSLDFVVRGKEINCYNYDGSFSHHPAAAYNAGGTAAEDHNDFKLNDTVYISGHGGNAFQTTIIDKWSFIDSDGLTQYRFRWANFSEATTSSVVMSTTMSGTTPTGDKWTMLVSDALVLQGVVPSALTANINFTTTTTDSAGYTTALGISPTQLQDGVVQVLTPLNQVVASTKNGEVPFISLFDSSDKTSETSKVGLASSIQADAFTYTSATKVLSDLGGIAGDEIEDTDFDAFVVNNAIKISTAQSANTVTDDRYVGFEITLYRFDTNNIPYIQTRKITKWIGDGTHAVALVEAPWDPEYIPESGDSYLIKAPEDLRVSINPAMQLLDYMKSKRYGKGLDIEDIDLPTFKASATQCDTRSDVTMQFLTSQFDGSPALPVVGEEYARNNSGHCHFKGTVKSVTNNGTYTQIVFTDVLGQFIQKYRDYEEFNSGALIWKNSGAAVSFKARSGSSGTSATLSETQYNNLSTPGAVELERVSSSNTITPDVALDYGSVTGSGLFSGDGNPIIKSTDNRGAFARSGYSLYDAGNIKYWKLIGWDGPQQRYATRHQLNQTINTTKTVFSNINDILKQFNGILRYANGLYQLSVKSAANPATVYESISEEDIIGDIKVTDKGSKKTYNSIATQIIDPSNGFEPRSVSFFNSQYLREDNGVPKKGNFKTPSITNYFNARFSIKQFLDESRNGLQLQFKVRPSGLLLLAGEVTELTYKRFGWDKKKWRITNLNFQSDGIVAVTCDEHSDVAYIVNDTADDGRSGDEGSSPSTDTGKNIPEAPSGLTATTNLSGGILLEWANARNHNPGTHITEIFRSSANAKVLSGVTTTAATAYGTTITVNSTSALSPGVTLVGGFTDKVTFTSGSFVQNSVALITALGTEDWNTVANTSGKVYAIGDPILVTTVGTSNAGGSVQTVERKRIRVATIVNGTSFTTNAAIKVENSTALTFGPHIVGESASDNFIDPLADVVEGNTTFYYWARHRVVRPVLNVAGSSNRTIFSNFFPATNSGITGTSVISLAERSVSLEATHPQFFYNLTGLGIENGYNTTSTITATAVNTQFTPSFKFEILDSAGNVISAGAHNNGNGAQTQTGFSSTNTFTFTAPVDSTDIAKAYEAMQPQMSVRATMREVVGGSNIDRVATFRFTAAKYIQDGVNRVFTASNAGHIFFANQDGATQNNFSSTISTILNRFGATPQAMSYDSSSPYSANSVRYGTARDVTNCSPTISSTGTVEIASNSEILESNLDHMFASFTIPVINNATGDIIGLYPFYLVKEQGERADLDLFYSADQSGGAFSITDAQAQAWAASGAFANNTANNTLAISIINKVITDESSINPGDSVQVIKVLADGTSAVGTRIYIGIKRTATGTAGGATDWSKTVVKRFDGSVIVDGTLRAETLKAGTTISNDLNVTNNLELGVNGKIFTAAKTSYTDSTAGIFLGYDTTGTTSYKLALGDDNNHVRWDGSNLILKSDTGNFSLKSGLSGSRVEIDSNGLRVFDGNTLRVKIGNLG